MVRRLFVVIGLVMAMAAPGWAARPGEGRGPVRGVQVPADLGVFPAVSAVSLERVTGFPGFVRGDLGRLPRGDAGTAAAVFMRSVAPAFGLGSADELRPTRSFTGPLGMTHVRLQQYHQGLPVDGGDVAVHATPDGFVTVINGHLAGGIDQLPVPGLRPVEALQAFRQRMEPKTMKVLARPVLVYYTRAEMPAFLAWKTEIEWSDGNGLYQERVYVDADDGSILDRQSLIWSARYRKIYTANNGTSLPGSLLFTEGGSSSDSVAMAAYNNFGYTYDFYSSVFGRDSYDNAGATLIGTVHYSSNYNNAYWNGSQMVFGDGDGTTFSPLSQALDVVAHELTHAVTENTANLTYSNESGALNEASSDIMGASCEEWVDGSVNANTWKIGEDIYTPGTAGDALRYMNDPAADGQSYDYYPTRYTGTSDNGGVHLNSGIANLAYYLMSQGGTHPRNKTSVVVPALGITEARAIWYRALTVYMTSSTNFEGARNATAQAAQDLYGATASSDVHKAWDAVGVPGTPVTVTALSNGQTLSNLSGASGSWAYYKISVPAGQTSLEIKIWGGSGDCDLYVKRGAKPTSSSYDYRPYLNGNNETVTVSNPASGDWYIGLNGYAAYSGMSLQATYTGGGGGGGGGVTVLQNGVAVTSLSGAQGADDFYKISVPSGQSSLEIKIYGGSGDCDLYVKYGAQPTTTSYDYRPYLTGNDETVTVSNPASGDWYIMLHGYAAYSGMSLKATYTAGGGGTMTEVESNDTMSYADIISGTPMTITAYMGSSSDIDYFRLTLPAGKTVTVDMAVPSWADYDIKLYNSSGTTLASSYNGTGQSEHMTYTNTGSSAMYVYIKVYSYSGYSSTTPYTVDVSW
ncbi:MAG: peptidase M4 [Acidobacteria bacterium]|nr:peptidase M4 [Acidobacteriota bacterium]